MAKRSKAAARVSDLPRLPAGPVDPQGCAIASFKAPTREELAHDFLWRIRRRLPGPGTLGVFDRSQYEDVLVVRVHGLVPRATWSRRYTTINRFEARLDDPTKHWKLNPRDVARW